MIDRERADGEGDVEAAVEPEVRRIEGYLKEMERAGEIPTDVPLAEAGDDDAFMHGDVEMAGLEDYRGGRDVAIAEPMTAHDGTIVALGDNVRHMTQLIESVGRTLEAQNQRSLRLMERLEAVAKALECLPEEADRGLEGLDAVAEAVKEGTAPLREIN